MQSFLKAAKDYYKLIIIFLTVIHNQEKSKSYSIYTIIGTKLYQPYCITSGGKEGGIPTRIMHPSEFVITRGTNIYATFTTDFAPG